MRTNVRSYASLAALAALALACGGAYSPGDAPAAPASGAPTVTAVSNDVSGLASGSVAGGDAVTVTGTGFADGATVRFGAIAATDVAFVSSTTLTARTPLDEPPGTVDVTVALPGTGLAGTAPRAFTFLGATPRALAFDVRGSPPAGGVLLNVGGFDFEASSTVTFGGVPGVVAGFTPGPAATGVLTVVVPPVALEPGATDAFEDVVVWNPDGQSSTLAAPFSMDGTRWPANFHYGPAPAVTGFSPGSGDGVVVTVTGSDFSADTAGPRAGMRVVLAGPSVVSLQLPRCPDGAEPACLPGVVSPAATSVLAEVPAGQLRSGEYALVVVNFDGQEARAPGAFVVP